jgi:class 3 adenylate cyclase/tetratricopeptide (TPR) repeat protein
MTTVGDERRVATVLFADIVGFTSLSEALDPEKVKNLVDRWFERLVVDITNFGGRVDKIIGDAIVALFGAPVAHEDDAERAVRAALRMQDTLAAMADETAAVPGDAVRMRIGVNTGEVLVGALRAGGDYTAMGDVVNTASRLQTAARPGEVLVGATTHAATSEVIRYEPRGLLTARGREARVEAWEAQETLMPPGYRPARRRVPLVGRDTELVLVGNAVDVSISHSRAQFALLVGEAGVGKTRLAAELALRAAEAHGALVFEGRCVPYGEANVWWPVAEALRHACFIDANAPAEEARSRTADRVAQAVQPATPDDSAEVERITDGLMHLMGYEGALREIEPSRAREESTRSLVAFIEASTRHQPSVIQLSDLHWADDIVLELIDTLFERLSRRPFVLLATARQTLVERWAPKPGRHNSVVVNLDPLDVAAASELLTSLLGSAPSPELRDLLLERSGGNPFFLEELVALLGDGTPMITPAGVSADAGAPVGAGLPAGLRELPDTLRGLVAARLDGLSPDERAVLTDAAVLGRAGPLYALERMGQKMGRTVNIDAVVADLVAKELFELSDNSWAFRSNLVREVAYGTLTKLDRARRHAGIAAWLESHHEGDWSDADVDRLARHYGVAAELVDELGSTDEVPADTREKAVGWIGEAARRAQRHEVLPVADRLFTQALTLLGDESSDRQLGLLLGRSQVRAEAWDLDGARADAELALATSVELGEETCHARALLRLGDIAQKAGDTDLAVRTLETAADRFVALGDELGSGEAMRLIGMAEMFSGNYPAAKRSVEAALEAFRQVGSTRGEAWALQNLAWIAFSTGRTEEAEARLLESMATFREIGDVVGRGWAQGLLSFVTFQLGRPREAEALANEVLAEVRIRGDRWPTAMMLVLLSWVRLWAGRTDEAVEFAEEAADIFRALGDPYGQMQSLSSLGRSLVMAGRIEEGFAVLEEAALAVERSAGREGWSFVRGALAAACAQLGDPDRAVALGVLDAGIGPSELLEQLDTGTLGEGDWLVAVGVLWIQQGRADDAHALLSDAVEVAAAPGLSSYAVSGVALALAATGRRAEATALAEELERRDSATYLDRATGAVAAGLAFAAEGAAEEAARWLATAAAEVDGTGDRLAQAMVRIADAAALRALGDDGAEAAELEARSLLSALAIDASGWWCAFKLAAGSTAEQRARGGV